MWQLDIRNIAGIRSGDADLYPGINVVRAENWQGKSSFVAALQVVMGTTGDDGADHPLTDGASDGAVGLETEAQTYETELVRRGETVTRRGDTYLTDDQDRLCARLFAFLGEQNPVREAVRSGGDLAALLTEPLAVENIDEQIAQLKRERRSVETELERAEDAADRRRAVEAEIAELEEELAQLRAERDAVTDETDAAEERPDQEELSSKRAEKEQLQHRISTLENKIDRQEDRLRERREELAALTVPAEPDLSTDIEAKRAEITELEASINLLADLYRVNKRVLDEERVDLVTELDRTLAGDELDCWLCGQATSESAIADRLSAIDEKRTALRSQKSALQEEISEIRDRRDEIRTQRRRKQDLEAEVSELQVTLDENRSRLADLRERLDGVTEDVERLRANVEETSAQVADLESDIKYTQNELADRRAELDELETDAERRTQLQDERDALTAELESLRTRRHDKKRELAERFEETIRDIVATLEPGFEFARLTPKTDAEGDITDFDLVVARDGRETTLDALSQGEVEILGIVTALAGYETFDVADRVPVMLLDGLTALSNENFHAIVEYVRERPEILVTTAYPEIDEFEGHVLDPNRWDVVSDRQRSVP